ncbi:hypothetical protein EAS61_09320 [Bradyrhizobium zhanjiangense]|uniref:Uncharacterized protein n=1 Tax=Bradyrhizobium zhanjiangense TaxID=1325107 RepID=A0A4Q0QT98_9BRAD|nr:hypothetical protein EAS61_09320 [Bradyrhizobium zhanjiangense]
MSGGAGPLPPPLAGETGEGVSKTGQSPSGESPHPRLRRDLSRKRERFSSLRPHALPRATSSADRSARRQPNAAARSHARLRLFSGFPFPALAAFVSAAYTVM